jgi:hypothetical protein
MKLLLLFSILLPLALTASQRECKAACNAKYDVGGRVATYDDKGEYGYNKEKDCTCVFPWNTVCCNSQLRCDIYCARKGYKNSFCYYTSNMCILHVGINVHR